MWAAHGSERIFARGEVKLRLVGERVGDAVGRRVGVSGVAQGGGHLGDDAVSEGGSGRPAGVREEVLTGVFGDDLGFGADRVGEWLLPDLVSELIWLGTGEMHVEDEWVAVAHALISRGQLASGGQSSLVACWR